MKVNAQCINFNADQSLLDFLKQRLDKLETFYDKAISFDVYLKVVSISSKENKVAEIKVNIPRDKYVVKKQCKSFEEAVDPACGCLERKLIKRKEKLRLTA